MNTAAKLAELWAEPLSAKHRRLRQAKCRHEEVYGSTVICAGGAFTSSFCWDCGKSWHEEDLADAR